MATTAKVKVSQPHINQVHIYLRLALEHTDRIRNELDTMPSTEIWSLADEVAILLRNAKQALPPQITQNPLF